MKFLALAEAFDQLEKTSSRLEMTSILAELFKKTDSKTVKKLVYLLQGRVAPPFEPTEIGMGEKLVEQSIALASGYKTSEVEKSFRETGDLGVVAEQLAGKKAQKSLFPKQLTVEHVFEDFLKIAVAGGAGSQETKVRTLAELLNNASPLEARFLVRVPLGKLRLGIGDPTIIDAFSVMERGTKELRTDLERAYNLCSDLGLVAETFWNAGLAGVKKFRIRVDRPIRPALAERLPSGEDIIEKIGKCAVEAKYDGFRVGIYKKGSEIRIFSRRLEDTTAMFPEIVAAARGLKPRELILEGEALSFNEVTGEYYPFQMTIQRKRKYGVAEMAKQFPLVLFAFDVLFVDGKDLTQEPYSERRKALEKIVPSNDKIRRSEMIVTDSAEKLEKFFDDCVSRGLEGIIAKDLGAPYVAGARKFAWIKLKRSYKGELADTIDLVILGYNKGRGQRTEFGIGAVLGGVYDEKTDSFKTLAKVGSGLTEEKMADFKRLLDEIRVKQKPARVESALEPDVWVEPKYVVTVNADEITESPIHTAGMHGGIGYALRFPRIVSDVRRDKKPEEATTVSEIISLFKMQKRTKEET